jgi:hypothetical protein
MKQANDDLKAYNTELKRKEKVELDRIKEYGRKKDAMD